MRFSMTGEALLATLDQVYQAKDDYPDAYWVASGLNITFAPWAGEGNRIVSVTLADGTEIDPKGVYTIAAWNASIDPALILSIEVYYDDTAAELCRRRVEAEGSIKPQLDKSFILDWDLVV